MSKRYSKKMRECVDSVGVAGHQSAVEIINMLEQELENIKEKVRQRIGICICQNVRSECKNCGLRLRDISGEINNKGGK